MNQLFSLYYYEVKKNKNKFLIVTLLVIVFFLLALSNMFFNKSGEMNLIDVKNIMTQTSSNNHISENVINSINMHSAGSIRPESSTTFILTIQRILGVVLVVVLSFGILTNGFGRRRKNCYIYSCLPVKIWKIKLSRILCCVSLYVYYILSISLSLILMGAIEYLYLGKYYSGISFLFYPELVFMPADPKLSLFVAFVFMPACIAGMQMIVNLLFISVESKKIVRKIFSILILFICSMLMIGYIVLLQIYSSFNIEYGMPIQIENILSSGNSIYILGMFIFPILFILMFLVDVSISKKKYRGGV